MSLEVTPDSPAQSGIAMLVADVAFGTGSQAGQNVLAQDTYGVSITSGALSIPSMTLMSQTFNLTAGTTYWETFDVISLGQMGPPGSLNAQAVGRGTATSTLGTSANTATYGQP